MSALPPPHSPSRRRTTRRALRTVIVSAGLLGVSAWFLAVSLGPSREASAATASQPWRAVPASPSALPEKGEPTPNQGESTMLLQALAATYGRPEISPAQIRLQGHVQKALSQGTLSDAMACGELSKSGQPLAYRLFLAKALRNLAKEGVGSERAQNLDRLISDLFASPTLSLSDRAHLGPILIDVRDTKEVVARLQDCLAEPSDAVNLEAITALRRSQHPEAQEALWKFTQRHADQPDERPQALASALTLLSHDASLPLESTLQTLATHTLNAPLAEGVLRALSLRPSSETVVRTVLTLHQRLGQFPDAGDRLQRLSAAALKPHASFIQGQSFNFNEQERQHLHHLLNQS